METAAMMPSIMSGSLIRATPPCARMSAGTRSSAITATAPASSAILAWSGVTTSMMTPPLSISAMPRLTRVDPVTGSASGRGEGAADTAEPRRVIGQLGQLTCEQDGAGATDGGPAIVRRRTVNQRRRRPVSTTPSPPMLSARTRGGRELGALKEVLKRCGQAASRFGLHVWIRLPGPAEQRDHASAPASVRAAESRTAAGGQAPYG